MSNQRLQICILLAPLLLLSVSCSKSKSGDPSASASAPTGVQKEASDAAFAEIARHCVKTADGWTTGMVTGSPYQPDVFLRQFREIMVDQISSEDLNDADRLNGVEWKGSVIFKELAVREAGEPGPAMSGLAGVNRQRGQWSPWFSAIAESFLMTKTKGKWDVYPNSVLIRGTLPTAKDYANAGVK